MQSFWQVTAICNMAELQIFQVKQAWTEAPSEKVWCYRPEMEISSWRPVFWTGHLHAWKFSITKDRSSFATRGFWLPDKSRRVWKQSFFVAENVADETEI